VSELVIIGIGGNIGDPRETIERSFQALAVLACGDIVTSSIWRSEAFRLKEEGSDFANAVATFQCDLEPRDLLSRLQSLEVKFGRPADHADHQSRTLDLDIIAFGQRKHLEASLKIPHPRGWERLFVLLPLQEIDPDFRFVDREESLQQLIDSAPRMEVHLWDQNSNQPADE
jgi:2-amino-4-hydroxy-6-hydroxymethyldihydropteridine diphosphokinase